LDNYKQLITEIDAINQAWHSMQALLTNESPITTSLRDIKGRLQLRLLREFSDRVHLEIDPTSESEPLYSVKLQSPVSINIDGNTKKFNDAKHLPERKVKYWLEKGLVTESELQTWLNVKQES
jgi:hypothetical protein